MLNGSSRLVKNPRPLVRYQNPVFRHCLSFRVVGAQSLCRLPPEVAVVKTTQTGQADDSCLRRQSRFNGETRRYVSQSSGDGMAFLLAEGIWGSRFPRGSLVVDATNVVSI
jgi:hypothetical protein